MEEKNILFKQSNLIIQLNVYIKPFEIVNAGDHCDLKISKQMRPFPFIFG